MKSIVVADGSHQSDFKPAGLLAQYVDLLQKDVEQFLIKDQALKDVVCPACGSADRAGGFDKFGMVYRECAHCGTLYVSPRPSDEQIVRFYREAPSRSFWSRQLSEVTGVQRKEKIIKPRMEWVADSIAEHCPRAEHWVDLHSSQRRYVDAMASTSRVSRKTITCPYFDISTGLPAGISADMAPWWEMKIDGADVVTIFELLDQASDVAGLMSGIRNALGRNGLCFITAILASGFDVKELGAHAGNIFPPDRLNVFSVKGLKVLLEKNGFELLEFSTPGVLDVDIVQQALKGDPQLPVSKFIRDLVLGQGEDVKHSFQEFLQANLLSSYGRILVKKL